MCKLRKELKSPKRDLLFLENPFLLIKFVQSELERSIQRAKNGFKELLFNIQVAANGISAQLIETESNAYKLSSMWKIKQKNKRRKKINYMKKCAAALCFIRNNHKWFNWLFAYLNMGIWIKSVVIHTCDEANKNACKTNGKNEK